MRFVKSPTEKCQGVVVLSKLNVCSGADVYPTPQHDCKALVGEVTAVKTSQIEHQQSDPFLEPSLFPEQTPAFFRSSHSIPEEWSSDYSPSPPSPQPLASLKASPPSKKNPRQQQTKTLS